MDKHWLKILQLDKQLKEWQSAKVVGRPRVGWVKTLRDALSMSGEQLANRLGVKRARVSQLEQAEIHDAVTLNTLRKVADAMECELIYAIVPKATNTIEGIIKNRAKKVAAERVAAVAHSMSLEAQTVKIDLLMLQEREIAKNLYEHLNKKLWADQVKLGKTISSAEKKQKNRDDFSKSLTNYLTKKKNERKP